MAPLICGFSYGRNLVKLDYPVAEAIRSVLPACDRYLFLVGDSDDATEGLIRAIDPKIQVIRSRWPQTTSGGELFRIEGQKVMGQAGATGTVWGLHQFCDEVYQELDLPGLRAASRAHADAAQVKALLVRMVNFAFDYRSVDPWMYRKACRIYRLDDTLELYGDGCGPGIRQTILKQSGHRFQAGSRCNYYLDKHHLGGHVRWARDPAGGPITRIFHYAWGQTE